MNWIEIPDEDSEEDTVGEDPDDDTDYDPDDDLEDEFDDDDDMTIIEFDTENLSEGDKKG